jgi:hypothetical protein
MREEARMSDSPRWTRRSFLDAVGRAGGAAAVYETMVAMGMIRVPKAFAGPPQIADYRGRGERVVILGAHAQTDTRVAVGGVIYLWSGDRAMN